MDYADDPALLSHTQQQMQERTSILETAASKIGPCINKDKIKLMKINAKSTRERRELGGRGGTIHLCRQCC